MITRRPLQVRPSAQISRKEDSMKDKKDWENLTDDEKLKELEKLAMQEKK